MKGMGGGMRCMEKQCLLRTLANISSIQATTHDEPKDISLSGYQVTIAAGQLTHLFYIFYCFKIFKICKIGPICSTDGILRGTFNFL